MTSMMRWGAMVVLVVLGTAGNAWAQGEEVANPIQSGKIGDKAYYNFELSTPTRADVGSVKITLKDKSGGNYTVEETLRQGDGGETTAKTVYPLKATMKAQVEAIYGVQFTDLVITKTELIAGIEHVIDGKKFEMCQRLHFEFEGTNQGTKCKGDLYYDLHKDAGPMGMVMFRSIVSYETAPGRFSLTQNLTMRLATEPPK